MYFHKYLKNTVKDEIENNNGNVVIYACDGNKKTKVQKKAWSQYEDCKNFSTFTRPTDGTVIIHVDASKKKCLRESSEVTVSDLIDYLQGVIDELEDEYSKNDIVNISPNTYRMGTPMAYYNEGFIDLNDLNSHIEVVDEEDDDDFVEDDDE